MCAFMVPLIGQIATIEAGTEELHRRLKGKASQDYVLPPSMQHPHARTCQRRRKSKQRRGGQPHHPKRERQPRPNADCDHGQRVKPSFRQCCGKKLPGSAEQPLQRDM